ncbi:hypothetical protein RJ55_06648 [Drechmeria coniospora]|nr:hypothetical protein RJ55_06648 [Drechmeria coniospora]
MSDVEATPTTKIMAWTDEAKVQFLLRIIAQLREDGRCINWNRINIPGRTIKSMQNMWTKVNKEIAEIETSEGIVSTPTKPRRGRPKASQADKSQKFYKSEAFVRPGDSDDDDEAKGLKKRALSNTPVKRERSVRVANTHASKRIKKNLSDDDGGDDEAAVSVDSDSNSAEV